MDALHTPIIGDTPEARALEEARMANLVERTRLENLQHALDERARQRVPESSRRQLFPPPTQVYRTPIHNLTTVARIAESIQPSQSEAGRGLLQIRALLRAAGDQNSAVSQSRNRIHSRSVAADTVQSDHSPRSPPRREGRGDRRDQYRRNEQYDHRFDHDDRRRVPTLHRGVDHMRLNSRMTDALIVLGGEFQSTPGYRALMRDPFSFKVWSTGTEL